VVLKSQINPLSKHLRRAYELYFGCKVGDEVKVWGLRICCVSCSRTLAGDKESKGFAYLKQKLCNVSEAKLSTNKTTVRRPRL
jgi:hypothetical protein